MNILLLFPITFHLSNQFSSASPSPHIFLCQLILKGLTRRSYLIIEIRATCCYLLARFIDSQSPHKWQISMMRECIFLMFYCLEAIISHTIGHLLYLYIQFLSSQVSLKSYCKEINRWIIGLERVLQHHIHSLKVKQQNMKTISGG